MIYKPNRILEILSRFILHRIFYGFKTESVSKVPKCTKSFDPNSEMFKHKCYNKRNS